MKKAGRVLLGALLGLVLAVGLFGSGVAFGGLSPHVQQAASRLLGPFLPPVTEATASTPIVAGDTDRETFFAPFWQAWDIAHTRFVDQPVDDVALLRGAIRGMLDALGDEHTAYMDPDQYRQANIGLSGEYEGIGAFVDTDGEFLTIVSPMPGSPAEKAGVKAGDVVVAVDGDDVTGIDPSLVVQRILGPKGTTVRLTLRREGETELLEVSVVRDSINIPSVEGRLLDGGVGYIQLNTFGEETTCDLKRAVADLMGQDARGPILDLRGNGGGYLTTAVDVSSEFLAEGVVLTERFGDGREEVSTAARREGRQRRSRWSCWWTGVQPRRRRSSPARCRTTDVLGLSVRPPTARDRFRTGSHWMTNRAPCGSPSLAGTHPRTGKSTSKGWRRTWKLPSRTKTRRPGGIRSLTRRSRS